MSRGKSFAAHPAFVQALADINSCGSLCENSRLKDVMWLDGQLICCVGSCNVYANTYDVIPVKAYKGPKPLPYKQFGLGPEKGYEGMLAIWRGKEYALTNERRFLVDKTVKKMPDTRKPEEREYKSTKDVIDLW